MRIRRSKTLLFTTILAFVFTLATFEAHAQDEPVAKVTSTATDDTTAPLSPAVDAPTRTSIGPANTGLTRVGVQTGQPISLSLDEAIRRALANNNSIEITRD